MREKETDVPIIAEPITILEGNWIGSNNRGAAICWSNKIMERTKVLIKEEYFVAMEVGGIVIFSCYISPNKTEGIL